MLSTDDLNELYVELVKAYESGRPNRSIGLLPEAMKNPALLGQLAEWRAKKLIVNYAGIPSVIQCTDEGYTYFKDRGNAVRVLA
jgi:hypothetical protein